VSSDCVTAVTVKSTGVRDTTLSSVAEIKRRYLPLYRRYQVSTKLWLPTTLSVIVSIYQTTRKHILEDKIHLFSGM
jgi:hypothetical protein